MNDEIIPGHDCCRDYHHPNRNPRIYPSEITMNAGENINLYLKLVHPSCYESCFTWRIVRGGGYVDPEFGIETYYHAPDTNDGCAANPIIECRCPRERIGRVHIAINGYRREKLAYFDVRSWKDGSVVVDGRPLRMPPPTKHFWNLSPDYAATIIYHRDCSGAILETTAIGLIQQPRSWGYPKNGLWDDRFQGCFYANGIFHLTREFGPTYSEAKYWILRQHLGAFVDTGMPTGETVAHWLPWYAGWASLAAPFAGGANDVRNAGMLEAGCCHYDLIPEEPWVD